MPKEEVPAIICFVLIAIIFLAAFWLDTRRMRSYQGRPNRLTPSDEDDRSTSTKSSAEN